MEGQVEIIPAEGSILAYANSGYTLCPGDRLRVLDNSRALLVSTKSNNANESVVFRLAAGTVIRFPSAKPEKPTWLEMLKGAIYFLSRSPQSLEVKTPFANAYTDGTEFVLSVEHNQTKLWVYEGNVRLHNPAGSLKVAKDEAAVAEPGKAPRRVLVVNPRDAVQWALYYPPLIDFKSQLSRGAAGSIFRKALWYYRQDNLAKALQALEELTQKQRERHFYTLHAGLLLSVGRVNEARQELSQALRLKPTDGIAHALLSIIALVNNDKERALVLAQQAMKEEPDSPVPYMALSYVEQSRFKLDDALQYVQKALSLSDNNALIQARLAELWLMQGELDKALKIARQAVILDPELARTQTVLGFAHLTEMETTAAKIAFNNAINLDSSNPLPHLGLGLAKIRLGQLQQGRHDIEIAASLDPNNALIRSYLGKAYYEEKRNPLAMDQYEMAKYLDPKDPTPYLYDALRKQAINRPVEALYALQKSIELNDNRAIYRSKLLLDDDIATRSSSLGRIYRNLGFEERALLEGWKSVNTEPTNYSAHRLLADSYSALQRHENARVSELLVSQLLQPLNTTPIQPQLAESYLRFLGDIGPHDSAFNEFNPLFDRNRLTFQGSAIFGSNHTYGDELTQSGLWDNFSYSIGRFHYYTHGFRANNDLKDNIYNIFLQAKVGSKTSVQAEFRNRDTKQGDRAITFDPNIFSTTSRRQDDNVTARFGFHHNYSATSNIIGSFIFRDTRINTNDTSENLAYKSNSNVIDYNGEVQYLLHWKWLNQILGFSRLYAQSKSRTKISFIDNTLLDIPDSTHSSHTKLYSYSNVELHKNARVFIGLTIDSFKQNNKAKDYHQISPKFGLMWSCSPKTTLRLAAFRGFSQTAETIEPTQIAGFSQSFDDVNGTSFWQYGIGFDYKLSKNLYGGIEFSTRDLKIPYISNFTPLGERINWKEQNGRLYLNWMPHSWWALSMEYNYENIDRGERLTIFNLVKARTHRIPLTVNFFHPSGTSWQIKATYVNQSGIFLDDERFSFLNGHDDFWIVDAKIDYRLPKRYGILSFIVKNVFDKDFSYFQQTDPTKPTTPLFEPGRQFFGRLTLAF